MGGAKTYVKGGFGTKFWSFSLLNSRTNYFGNAGEFPKGVVTYRMGNIMLKIWRGGGGEKRAENATGHLPKVAVEIQATGHKCLS